MAVVLGPHGKRMVVLTTLYMQLSNMQKFNKEKMHELNQALDIVQNEDALEFPSLLNNAVWGSGIPQIKDIDKEETAITYIMSLTPGWLCYNRGQMTDDFKKIIQNTGAMQHAAHA